MVKISFNCEFDVIMESSSLPAIMKAFCKILPLLLTDFMRKVILAFAEHYMQQRRKPFVCECGNDEHFIWKTRHGRPTGILTVFMKVMLDQLQVQCKVCGRKKYITRKLLCLEPRQRIPADTRRKLGLLGALATFRVSEKIVSLFGWAVDKMTIWRSVQQTASEIEFGLDPRGLGHGEADGTGIPIQGIKKRGKEMKVFVQLKRGGGIRIAGLSIDNYDKGWDKLFTPLIETMKSFSSFLLVTDGDTSIFKGLKGKVKVILQRCLWHIPHQLKYKLWEDKVKRKSEKWLHVMAEIFDICAISARLAGKTISRAERVMRTINLRINVGKWSTDGALNVNKVRLAYYYNGFDVG